VRPKPVIGAKALAVATAAARRTVLSMAGEGLDRQRGLRKGVIFSTKERTSSSSPCVEEDVFCYFTGWKKGKNGKTHKKR
jgi:hypothetical protein